MRLFEGLAQGGGFLAVAAFEVGELGGQRAHHAGGMVLAGEGGGTRAVAGAAARSGGARSGCGSRCCGRGSPGRPRRGRPGRGR